MVVSNKNKFNAKYGFSKNAPHSKAEISRLSGIPIRILNQVYNRGVGAKKTSPNSVRRISDGKKGGRGAKMSAEQWAMARIYSFVMKQPGTWGKADKDLADKVRVASKKKK
tara:strand:+ start:17 stop:349 length:333 start_codon:yes stop_codon:yes gene_type:complete